MIIFSDLTLLFRRLTTWAMVTFSLCLAALSATVQTQISLAFSRWKDTPAKTIYAYAVLMALGNFAYRGTKPKGKAARKTLKLMKVFPNCCTPQNSLNRQNWEFRFDTAAQRWQLLLTFAHKTNQVHKLLTVDEMNDPFLMKETNNSYLFAVFAPFMQGSHLEAQRAAETAKL